MTPRHGDYPVCWFPFEDGLPPCDEHEEASNDGMCVDRCGYCPQCEEASE